MSNTWREGKPTGKVFGGSTAEGECRLSMLAVKASQPYLIKFKVSWVVAMANIRSLLQGASAIVTRVRFWLARLVYDQILLFLIDDESWQETLLVSVAPKPGDRILIIGARSSFPALAFARAYPAATFSALDTNSRTIANTTRRLAKKQMSNLILKKVSSDENVLSFEVGSFDKVICMLALHHRTPAAKLLLLKEFVRVLRRSGLLHVLDFDKPQLGKEGGILEFAGRISGSEALVPHLNGTWLEFFAKAGLTGVRRQSSHSIGIGRISVIKARKH